MEPVEICSVAAGADLASFLTLEWERAKPVMVSTYWSGEEAPATRAFEARLLWSASALYVRFEAEQHEPLVVTPQPDLSRKTVGLWERDVCEVFIAPDPGRPNKYFEFEVAPTGEWIDLAIEVSREGRATDFDFASGMEAVASVEDSRVVEAIKIPFTAFGTTPRTGDVWLGNLFRCVGSGPDRGYLAWRPTRTKVPSFHVSEAFGEFRFVD